MMTRRQRRTGLALLAALALDACGSGTAIEQTNAAQQEQLNAIAANTSEDAGSDAAQNAAATSGGPGYQAAPSAPPRKY